jgi:GntR family transcriptional regulator of arabinose operon
MTLKRVISSALLAETIRRQITSGKLKPNEPILSGPRLSEKYHLSYPTVSKVMDELVKEKLVYRIKGKGTFVAPQPGQNLSKPLLGLSVRTQGHLYEEIHGALLRHALSAGYWPVTLDFETETFRNSPEPQLAEFLSMPLAGLIVEGIVDFPYNLLKKNEDQIKKLVFINRFETRAIFRADTVLSDYEMGGYLVARHLLELGHRRILVDCYADDSLGHQSYELRKRGYLRAIAELGLPSDILRFVSTDQQEKVSGIAACFQESGRPSAVIAMNDYRAKLIIDTLRQLNLSVPEEAAVFGYYNTPWAKMTAIPLSTVSIREEEIARQAVARIKESGSGSVRLLVEPELMLGASCGATLHHENIKEAT